MREFPDGVKRRWATAAGDYGTGEFHVFDHNNTPYEDIPDAAVASSSIPGIFPPHHYNGRYYMDGGTISNLNLNSAV